MKKKKEKNENIELMKKIWKNPRGKALLFFLFYFLFFFLLIIMLRNDQNGKQKLEIKGDSTNKIKSAYKLDKLKEGNYHFIRTEKKGNMTTVFEGDSNQGKSKVVMTREEEVKNYFFYHDMVLEQQGDHYIIGVNPYLYEGLQEYETIEKILKKATLKSKTTFEEGEDCYQYEITTTTLVSILDKKETDLSLPVNKIDVFVNSQNELSRIVYSLDSYHAFTMMENIPLTIEIKYQDYGEIEEMEIPE